MKGSLYRSTVSGIVRKSINKRFPGLKMAEVNELCSFVAIAIHAKLYGANVNGVESPIWRDALTEGQSDVSAETIIIEGIKDNAKAADFVRSCLIADSTGNVAGKGI